MPERDVPEQVIADGEEAEGRETLGKETSKRSHTLKGGNRPDGGYTYELKRLRSRHHLIIRLMATGKFKQKDVADMVGVTPQTVSNVMRSELAQQKLAHLQGEADLQTLNVMDHLQELSAIAVAEFEEILMDDSVEVSEKIKVGKEILDRAGYGKTSNVHMRHERVSDSDIREIKQEAKRRAEDSGMIEDANVVSETSNQDD